MVAKRKHIQKVGAEKTWMFDIRKKKMRSASNHEKLGTNHE